MEKLAKMQTGSEEQLPHSMATLLAGWSARANQYPIFSKTWYVYRMRSFLWPLVTLALVNLVIAVVIASPAPGPYRVRFYFTFVAMWLVVAIALGLGRGLAVLVARRNWTPRREAAGIACALLFGMLTALALTPFVRAGGAPAEGRTPTTQQIAEERDDRLVNLIVWIPIVAWLGGPFDLAAYFRQRGLLREFALQRQADRYRDQRNQVEARLSVLASQVEPHFLFNTLAGVRAAIASDPARGIVLIDHLIDYLRSTIPQLRSDQANTFVALGSQLDSVQAYLGIIQVRMPRLTVGVECAPGLRDAAIPPLMLISLVENAVKHGIELKKGPALVRVTAESVDVDGDRRLELTVADDGVGFGATAGSGIGLSNIRERLQHLYGGEAKLSLRSGDAGGVLATIALPLRFLADARS